MRSAPRILGLISVFICSVFGQQHNLRSDENSDRKLVTRRSLVIYGTDDRIEESAASTEWKSFGQADVMLVYRSSLTLSGSEYTFNLASYGQSGWCSTTSMFQDQATLGWCSGTLVGDKYVSTAGHCINEATCSGVSFIFGATNTQVATGRFPQDHVYHCAEIVAQVNRASSAGRSLDMAVVKLDQVVPSNVATPVPVRLTTQVNLGERLLMVGHPYGLPKKYADGAIVNYINSLDGEYYDFHAPLDAFGGNSGSGVWSLDANEMVGILIEGATDYVTTSQGCKDANFCTGTTTSSTGVQYTNCDAGPSSGYLYGEKLAGSMQIYAECTGTPDTSIVKNTVEWQLVCTQLQNNAGSTPSPSPTPPSPTPTPPSPTPTPPSPTPTPPSPTPTPPSPTPTPPSPTPTPSPTPQCTNTDNGARDSGEDDCAWYTGREAFCGSYDDGDFTANSMCCVCGGGRSATCTDIINEGQVETCAQFELPGGNIDCDFHATATFTPSAQCCACGGGSDSASSSSTDEAVAIAAGVGVGALLLCCLLGCIAFMATRSKREGSRNNSSGRPVSGYSGDTIDDKASAMTSVAHNSL